MKTVVLRAAAVLVGASCLAATATPLDRSRPASTQTVLRAELQQGQECPGIAPWEGTPWWVRRSSLKDLWREATGKNVKVAVIDSGVQPVPQLKGNLLPGKDFLDGMPNAQFDDAGHGTAVAGVIAAKPMNGTGVVGIAPGAQILPIRQNDGKRGDSENMAAAINWAVAQGADIINISQAAFAKSPDDPPPVHLYTAISNALRKNVVIIAAAGNDGTDRNRKPWPAADERIISVGASNDGNSPADFSGYGPWMDLLAPGVNMVTTHPRGGHCMYNGTSFAAPYVTGVVALIRERWPNEKPADIARRLIATADRVGNGWSESAGWGVVNARRAVLTPPQQLPRFDLSANVNPEYVPIWPIERLSAAEKRERVGASLTVVIGLGLVTALSFAAVVAKDAAARRRRMNATAL
ncbi:Major intracellular serine protease precursor [Carbonactinospora thermoautotrophica]|uniref:Major intracellular serine protease n=1 Tax=Carbonactinospora thermoautotrophica TaxID=1469144 RepID=A0A132MPQ4_9ACTN|nr:type VII secretion-associated serine protease mycosin [Carbonactinospora thermoautotrophica]KWW99715.1 Major intracellular serine protease precursor [Carbonactinospora thermoautotrophica]